jgi:hypothetical protein
MAARNGLKTTSNHKQKMATVEQEIQFNVTGLDLVLASSAALLSLSQRALEASGAVDGLGGASQALAAQEGALNASATEADGAAAAQGNAADAALQAGEAHKQLEGDIAGASQAIGEASQALGAQEGALNATATAAGGAAAAQGNAADAALQAGEAHKQLEGDLAGAVQRLVEASQALAAQVGALDAAGASARRMGEEMEEAAPKARTLVEQVGDIRNAVSVARTALNALRESVAMFAPVMEDASRLANLSRATGESVADLVLLEQAMRSTGAQGENAGAVFSRLARVVEDARPGSATQEAFRKLGVSLHTFAAQAPLERLRTLQEAFARIEDRSRRTALAMQLFGGQGQALLPLLMNVNALDEARQSAGSFADGMQRNAETFLEVKRRLDELSSAAGSGLVEALRTLAPAIQVLTSLIKGIPVRWLASAILATSAVMVLGAVAAITKVSMALKDQAASWFSVAKATDAATASLGRNTAASAAAAGASRRISASNKGVTLAGGGRAAIAGTGVMLAGGLLSEAAHGKSGLLESTGNILATGGTLAMLGSILGPYGAAAGAVAGVAIGIGSEVYTATEGFTALTQAQRDAAKAAREVEENVRLQARAIEAARDPVERIEAAIRSWADTQAKSRLERIRGAGEEVMGISLGLKLAPETDAAELLEQIRARKARLEEVLARDPQAPGAAAEAAQAAEELAAIAARINAVEALAGRQKALREQEAQANLALFKSQQAVELEGLETSLKKKEILERDYIARRKEMLAELHEKERGLDTDDNFAVNENRRMAEAMRLSRELEGGEKSTAGRREVDFRPSDASVRVGLNVGAAQDASVTFQRGILDESRRMRITMEQVRDKVDFGGKATWASS